MRRIISGSKFIVIPLIFISIILVIWLIPINRSYTQVPPKREMRAVWISTVMNIDWPSSWKLTPQKQKEELIRQLDMHKKNGMNTIVFQIRPSADAFYNSKIEPWSLWLTGKQGQAPNPYYDPLQFAIEECHKRNMEFHAWINPFRAVNDTSKMAQIDSMHISKRKPEWFHPYGKILYFDPGIPAVRKYIVSIIAEVVYNYDIDAIHFDDYFYPYKIAKQEFADSMTYKKNKNGFTKKQMPDWRRNNIDLFIKATSDTIKHIKTWVKFGVSPFGVWRNKQDDPLGSDTRAGHPCYDVLMADVLKWLKNGWIDYITPQIYWSIGNKAADFKILVEWWKTHTYNRALYIGHGVYKIDKNSTAPEWQSSQQVIDQIEMIRSISEIQGSMFFSSKSFFSNPDGLNDKFTENIFSTPALIPKMPWIDNLPPAIPANIDDRKERNGIYLTWKMPETKNEMDKASYYVIYRFYGKEVGNLNDAQNIYAIIKEPQIFIENKRSFFSFFRKKYTFVITAVDRLHNESNGSKPITLKLR